MTRLLSRLLCAVVAACVLVPAVGCKKDAAAPGGAAAKPPLKIAYSDWPGWVAWDIAVQKGWFKEEGVDVEFQWMEYGPSMDAFTAGKADAVCVTNGDALNLGAGGKPSTCVVLNDYSNGNDMVVAAPGINSIKDLKGKTVGVELNLVDHLLLLKALEANGMSEADVKLKGMSTNDTPQALAGKSVDAIAAWQPLSGQALKQVAGSKALFTSKDVPGLIYDGLFVSKESVTTRREDWQKVAKVWTKVVAFIKDEKTRPEAVKIMAARVKVDPAEYAALLDGTFLLDKAGNEAALKESAGFDSVYGSSAAVNDFFVKKGLYQKSQDPKTYFDPSFVKSIK
ncbi:MAG TPA: ABC transporter substrate-binding protein [Humisphaera sp.]